MNHPFRLIIIIVCIALSLQTRASCVIRNSDLSETSVKSDLLSNVLTSARSCPQTVKDLTRVLRTRAIAPQPALVANRGLRNPQQGSFSFFESVVSSDLSAGSTVAPRVPLFFGHFTKVRDGVIKLDQEPVPGRLMVEAIAWDSSKGYYNFYELIGQTTGATWFYRGDTRDILKDNEELYLQPDGTPPRFGNRLRCAACHSSGGPIMKELKAPHNDWWTAARPLPFAPNHIDGEVAAKLNVIIDADRFAAFVKDGITTLEQSSAYRDLRMKAGPRVRLRPLFCETEINLESSASTSNQTAVDIPPASLLNPLLGSIQLSLSGRKYSNLLETFRLTFPETREPDADHAWLVPVKGYSDLKAIQSLIESGFITRDFARTVLSVDFEHPLFSPQRCALLRAVPISGPFSSENFLQKSLPNAALTTEVEAFVTARRNQIRVDAGRAEFENLLALRRRVFESDISKNKRGQILEPGFRVIFPVERAL